MHTKSTQILFILSFIILSVSLLLFAVLPHQDIGKAIEPTLQTKTTAKEPLQTESITRTTGSTKTSYFYANGKIAQLDGQKIKYIVSDHLGSTSKVLDQDGVVLDTAEYYAFGQGKIVSEEKYKYTGKEQDSETELYYYGARYYEPVIGRFLSTDKINGKTETPKSLNRYSYSLNNPVTFFDPDGFETVDGKKLVFVVKATHDPKESLLETTTALQGAKKDVIKNLNHYFEGENYILVESDAASIDELVYEAKIGAQNNFGLYDVFVVVAHGGVGMTNLGGYDIKGLVTYDENDLNKMSDLDSYVENDCVGILYSCMGSATEEQGINTISAAQQWANSVKIPFLASPFMIGKIRYKKESGFEALDVMKTPAYSQGSSGLIEWINNIIRSWTSDKDWEDYYDAYKKMERITPEKTSG